MLIGSISVNAMHRNTWSLRKRPNTRALVFGPSVHQESHVLGTTGAGEGAMEPTQAATGNTAVKTLALGNTLSSCYPKAIVISIEIRMGKHVKVSIDQTQIDQPGETSLLRFIDFF